MPRAAERDARPAPPRNQPARLRPVPLAVTLAGVLPNIVVAAVLFIAPVLLILGYSFGTLDFLSLEVVWGWTTDAYQTAFSQPYIGTFSNSLALAAATVACCMVPGFALALAAALASGRSRALLLLLILFPFWTSFIVRTYAWTNLLGPSGVVADFTGALGNRVVLLGSNAGILIGMVSAYLPIMVLPIYVALVRVPPVLIEAARDLGASDWRILWTVLIPGAASGLTAGALLVGIPATGEYVVPSVLGAGKTLLVGNLISSEMIQNGNYPLGAALTVALLAALMVALILALLGRRLAGRLRA